MSRALISLTLPRSCDATLSQVESDWKMHERSRLVHQLGAYPASVGVRIVSPRRSVRISGFSTCESEEKSLENSGQLHRKAERHATLLPIPPSLLTCASVANQPDALSRNRITVVNLAVSHAPATCCTLSSAGPREGSCAERGSAHTLTRRDISIEGSSCRLCCMKSGSRQRSATGCGRVCVASEPLWLLIEL